MLSTSFQFILNSSSFRKSIEEKKNIYFFEFCSFSYSVLKRATNSLPEATSDLAVRAFFVSSMVNGAAVLNLLGCAICNREKRSCNKECC